MASRNHRHRNNKTRKEIRAELVGEAQKTVQYQLSGLQQEVERLKNQLKAATQKCDNLWNENQIWRDRALAAEGTINTLNEHKERLMEYMDMSPEQRKAFIEKMQADAESAKQFATIADMYGTLLHGSGIGMLF